METKFIKKRQHIVDGVGLGDNFTFQGRTYRGLFGTLTDHGFQAREAPGGKEMQGPPVYFEFKKGGQ